MPCFFTGDELGNIKSIRCSQDSHSSNEWKLEDRIVYIPPSQIQNASGQGEAENAKSLGIQKLSIASTANKTMLATARANGILSVLPLNSEENKLEVLGEWKDSRFKPGQSFVGLDLTPKGLFWCTSNGALGLSPATVESDSSSELTSTIYKASLPMRLCAWHLSLTGETFTYGGDEVDLSVWDTERAFQSVGSNSGRKVGGGDSSAEGTKKRKRGDGLLPGEVWRAKNLPNDSLSLRQPIHITSLSYLNGSSNPSSSSIVTGTQTGDVRRYDTRAARRPISNWTGIGKVGGVSLVQAGLNEHEIFVADKGTNLSALDLRNGRIIYSFKKLQGAITSVASFGSDFLGSTSRDRFFRLQSTFPPPETAGQQQQERGEVLGSLYMKSIPSAVVADLSCTDKLVLNNNNEIKDREEMDEDEDVWTRLEGVQDSDEDVERVELKTGRKKGKNFRS